MPDIIVSNQVIAQQQLVTQCAIETQSIRGAYCQNPRHIQPFQPYLIDPAPSPLDYSILNTLVPAPVARNITAQALSYGGDNTLAVAQTSNALRDYNIALVGVSTSLYANRIGGFAGAVQNYQSALLEYRDAIRANGVMRQAARQKAQRAFDKMQRGFQNELRVVTARNGMLRKNPLASINRAKQLARGPRRVEKLHVMNQVHANALVKYSKYTKFLGSGLTALDFTSRAGHVYNRYHVDGNWERELFVESLSFTTSVVAGGATLKAGSIALGFIMLATPVGWIGLLFGGAIVAGISAGISVGVNQAIKQNSGSWYDSIIRWIRNT